jgi:uncharacterized membrane protein YhaH (DUF805 family)
MGVVNFLFNFNGRIGRLAYLFGLVSLMLIAVALYAVFGIGGHDQDLTAKLLEIIIELPLAVSCFALMAKRFHDLNKSAWWIVAFIGAIIGGWVISIILPMLGTVAMIGGFLLPLWQFIELHFFRGDETSNDFGPPPSVIKQLTGAVEATNAEPAWAAKAMSKTSAASAQTGRTARASAVSQSAPQKRTVPNNTDTTVVTRLARTAKLSGGDSATPNGFGRRSR